MPEQIDTRKATAEEAEELEHIVEVTGNDMAQQCAHKHMLPQLVEAAQRGFWRA
jgi:hypothetical protein